MTVARGSLVTTATMDLSIYDENVEPLSNTQDLDPPLDFFYDIDRTTSEVFLQEPFLPVKRDTAPGRFFWYHSINCSMYEGVKVFV